MKIMINLSMFVLLNVCSATALGNEEEFENFLKNQPKRARGSKSDLKQFWDTGECEGCNLHGFNLRAAIEKLNKEQKQINLENANCSKANMSEINMSNAILTKGRFDLVDFRNSNLTGIVALLAYMDDADLTNANIENANFNRSYLRGTKFEDAVVNEETSFMQALCIFTNFRKIVNLDKARFYDAILHKCEVTRPISEKMREQAGSITGTILRSY